MSLERPVSDTIDTFEAYLRDDKGNKPKSYNETIRRLRRFFDGEGTMGELTAKACQSLYDRLVAGGLAVDTHRNYLAEAKTFLTWCAARKWISANPLAEVKGKGKRRHGKPQLRIDEARQWLDWALWKVERGDGGSLAAASAFLMGLRASEVVERQVRDVDDGATILWVPDSKTEAGKRRVLIPSLLRSAFRRLTEDRDGTEWLFLGRHGGHLDRHTVRKCVKRICREVNVPEVCAHSMRGLNATLATGVGMTGEAVAFALGHEDKSTTLRSYAQAEVVQSARQSAALAVIQGARR
jgi:integrase